MPYKEAIPARCLMNKAAAVTLLLVGMSVGIGAQRGKPAATAAKAEPKTPEVRFIDPKETLKNVKVVTVTVDDIKADSVRFQLTADTIRNAVELRLRQTGITVKSA